ncbi:MAG: flagellar hook-basal body complex protein [Mariprofundales bacterium]|nr:flagellar hook-basal body complex protein [Mariprofundales bacterium]
MYSSLYTSKSGMMAFSNATNVIGNNLANVNSLGFKASTLLFSDMMSKAASGRGVAAASAGVQLAKIGHDMRQGQVQTTTSTTDMAINGKGMFTVKDTANGNSYYTRAGSFQLNKNFDLVNGQGFVVQGWQKDATGATVGTAPTNINIATFAGASAAALVNNQIVVPASATTKVNVGMTLAANAPRPVTTTFDPNDPTSYNFKSDTTLYDANGGKHITSLFFVRQGQDASGKGIWDWHAAVKGDQITGGGVNDANTMVEVGGTSYTTGSALAASRLPAQTTLASGTTLTAAVTSAFTLIDQNGNSATIPASGSNSWLSGSSLSGVAAANGLSNTGFYRIGSGGAAVPTATVGGTNALIQLPTPLSTFTAGVVDPAVTAAHRLEFDTSGKLVNEYAPKLLIPWTGGVAAGAVSVNMGSATTIDAQGITGTGLDGTLQLGNSFATNMMTSNGYGKGTLDKLQTDSSGVIHGLFSNGRNLPLAQVALASFGNPSALDRVGSNMLQASPGSGKATLLAANSSSMGSIVGSSLEQSNVNLSGEFVQLIVLQRGYEANSKGLTTTDQMLVTLTQLKR